jgi:acetyl esterase/lipase
MTSLRARAVSTVYRYGFKPTFRHDLTVELMRRRMQRIERIAPPPPRGTHITRVDLGSCFGEEISPRVPSARRTILYLPGGGFVMRTPKVHRALVGRLCRRARARALLVFYRLAPENPFPAGLEDSLRGYERLLSDGTSPADVVIGGDSAGGGMTLSMLLALRDRNIPLPAAAFTLSAVTDLRVHRNGSRTSNEARDALLSFDGSETWHTAYVGGEASRLSEPLVSPVLGDYQGLPPMLMQASSSEVLLDDTRLVADRARAAGVGVATQIFDGVPHVWHTVRQLPEARRALNNIAEFITHHAPEEQGTT